MLDVNGVIREFFTDKTTGLPLMSVQALYRAFRERQVPHVKVGRRIYFNEDTLREWSKGNAAVEPLHIIPE